MKMSKVTEKDTKKVILGYVAELEAQIAGLKEGTFNPEIVREETIKKENAEKAKIIVGLNILSPEIVEQYKALNADIEAKKKDLKELYEIDAKAETLAALIEANNLEREKMRKDKEELIAEKQAEIEELKERYDKLMDKLQDEYEEKEDNLQKLYDAKYKQQDADFERKLEENRYALNRRKVVDNDAWEDEKAKREAELKSREDAVQAREDAISNSEIEIASIRKQLEDMPEQIAKAKEDGIEEGRKKAESAAAIKYNYEKKEIELNNKLVAQENTQLKEALAKSDNEKQDIANKLEAAYNKINELAGKTVAASQPVYVNKGDK